jgi:hypothetical protein
VTTRGSGVQPDDTVKPTRALILPGLVASLALGVTLACSAPEPARDPASSATVAGSESEVESPPWYDRTRMLDLTGDGQADSVRLRATGDRTDSLRITLLLVVAGDEKHREEWGSSYELALVDSASRGSPRVDTVLRAELDSVLASVVVQRMDAPGARLMAEDSAVLAALEPRPTQRISFSYGYESTTRLVWDAPRQRFVRLWSCC